MDLYLPNFKHLSAACRRFTHTLAVQQRHGGPRLKTPQRLHAAALLQVQQLDQDDRVDIQEAAVAAADSTGHGAASSAAMQRTNAGAGSTCRGL